MPHDALERITAYWPAEVLSQDEHESLVRLTFPGTEIALFQAMAWSDVATSSNPRNCTTGSSHGCSPRWNVMRLYADG